MEGERRIAKFQSSSSSALPILSSFFSFLLCRKTDQDQVLDQEGDTKRPLTVNASFSFSARILSAAAWSTYGCKAPWSASREVQTGRGTLYLFLFIVHLLPLGSQQLSNLTYTWYKVFVFVISTKRFMAGSPDNEARAYRNRHQGSQP